MRGMVIRSYQVKKEDYFLIKYENKPGYRAFLM